MKKFVLTEKRYTSNYWEDDFFKKFKEEEEEEEETDFYDPEYDKKHWPVSIHEFI